MYIAMSLPLLSIIAHQPNLNQEGYDIADASLLLLLETIQEKHIFLTKEGTVVEMKKKKNTYSWITPIIFYYYPS